MFLKCKHAMTMKPALELVRISVREIKNHVITKFCAQMFLATLFIMSKNWKQHRCLSVAEGRFKQTSTSISSYTEVGKSGFTVVIQMNNIVINK